MTNNQIEFNLLKGNYLRLPYFASYEDTAPSGMLNFPTIVVTVGEDTCLLYDIPDERLQEVLDYVNPLKGVMSFPVNKCKKVPFSDEKEHYFSEAKIIFYNGHNYIIPPTFFTMGTTAMGWGIID